MKRSITFLCSMLFVAGCASHVDLTKPATSIQSFAIETYRWMHVQATSLNNQFQLCSEDCPKRTPKTLVTTSTNSQAQQTEHTLQLKLKPQEVSISKPINIYFSSTSFVLDDTAKRTLTQTISLLNHDLSINRILIRGRTDDLGAQSFNNKLAVNRGLTIRNYMRDNGLRSDIHMTVKGKGRCCYVADNATEEGRRQNRRVELLMDGDNAA